MQIYSNYYKSLKNIYTFLHVKVKFQGLFNIEIFTYNAHVMLVWGLLLLLFTEKTV